jgi:hypothetical protein
VCFFCFCLSRHGHSREKDIRELRTTSANEGRFSEPAPAFGFGGVLWPFVHWSLARLTVGCRSLSCFVRHQMRGTGHGNGGKGIWRHSVALIPLPSSETGEPSRETEAGEMVRPPDGQTVRMEDKDRMNTWTNQSVERTGMSRSGHWKSQRPRRLIPVAHLGRSVAD